MFPRFKCFLKLVEEVDQLAWFQSTTYCQLVRRLHICSYRLVNCNLGEPSYLQQPASLSSELVAFCLAKSTHPNGFESVPSYIFQWLRIPFSISQVILVLVVLTCSILKVFTLASIESTSASNTIFSAIRTGCFNVCILLYISYHLVTACFSVSYLVAPNSQHLPTLPPFHLLLIFILGLIFKPSS